jgi:hypothetical protein
MDSACGAGPPAAGPSLASHVQGQHAGPDLLVSVSRCPSLRPAGHLGFSFPPGQAQAGAPGRHPSLWARRGKLNAGNRGMNRGIILKSISERLSRSLTCDSEGPTGSGN